MGAEGEQQEDQAGSVPTSIPVTVSAFAGAYKDPMHDKCARSIEIVSASVALVSGVDPLDGLMPVCNGEDDVSWGTFVTIGLSSGNSRPPHQ